MRRATVRSLSVAAWFRSVGGAPRLRGPRRSAGRLRGRRMHGLDERWAHRILDAAGTCGDIYARNPGPASGLDVGRFANALWSEGGLHHPPPLH